MYSGLLGNVMDVNSGEWTGKMAGLGAGIGKLSFVNFTYRQ